MNSKLIFNIIVFIIATAGVFWFGHVKGGLTYFQVAGIYLLILILLAFVLNFVVKFIQTRKGTGEKYSYALPDPMAKAMKNVSIKTQYESAILSMFFIMIGMVAFAIYIIFFSGMTALMKFFIVFNSFWGIVFLFSGLVTQYQAYVTYCQAIEIFGEDGLAMPQTNNLNTHKLKGGKSN